LADLNKVDLFLIIAFTAELSVNLFANWWRPFVTNGWSILDFVIVVLSLVSLAPVGISLRLMLLIRCCRVLRIFGKLKSVAKIFSAVACSLIPMANAFFIIFIITAICAQYHRPRHHPHTPYHQIYRVLNRTALPSAAYCARHPPSPRAAILASTSAHRRGCGERGVTGATRYSQGLFTSFHVFPPSSAGADAMVAVTFYGETVPTYFDTFPRSFTSMFRIIIGRHAAPARPPARRLGRT
jgi:hypothetical protein